MGKKLPTFLLTYLVFISALIVAPITSMAQSTGAIIINEIYTTIDRTSESGRENLVTHEFVELVNNSSSEVDISGWSFSDSSGVRHIFPDGTIIKAKEALVLFGDSEENPEADFGKALVQYSSESATLSLDNGGDTITLKDDRGNLIQKVTYSNVPKGQSLNLDPEVTGTQYVSHSIVQGVQDNISPGTRMDGTAFSLGYSIEINGSEGWRFIAAPTQNTAFADLFTGQQVQTKTGLDSSSPKTSFLRWQEEEGGSFSRIIDQSNNLKAGHGYLVYLHEDEDPDLAGVQGGFPKTISSDNKENRSPVRVVVSAHDKNGSNSIDGTEGYNLLGNPYGTDISVAAVFDALASVSGVDRADLNANIYIWDPELNSGNGGYKIITDRSAERIAPFQAFFVRYITDGVEGNVNFDRRDLADDKNIVRESAADETPIGFEVRFGNGNKYDTYNLEFSENGTIGEDRYDGYKLFSLNPNAINFFSTLGGDVMLAKNVLPAFEALKAGEEWRIPFGYNISQNGKYTFNWNLPNKIPEDTDLYLVDNKLDEQINMRLQEEYRITLRENDARQAGIKSKSLPVLSEANESKNTGRFELKIVRAKQEVSEPESMQKPVTLSPNYPNPFNNQTRMDLDLEEKMHVRVTIWNIVGQKVATMKDEMMDAGQDHPLTWNVPANMPSGIYICKVEAGGTIITRKMTLVK